MYNLLKMKGTQLQYSCFSGSWRYSDSHTSIKKSHYSQMCHIFSLTFALTLTSVCLSTSALPLSLSENTEVELRGVKKRKWFVKYFFFHIFKTIWSLPPVTENNASKKSRAEWQNSWLTCIHSTKENMPEYIYKAWSMNICFRRKQEKEKVQRS